MSRSYKVNKISENEFSKLKEDWNSLLINSDSDNLFLRWEWVFNWWVTWRNKINNAELLVLVVFDGEEIIGIAPLYKDVRIINRLFAVKRIQFLGTAYQSISSIRTEYLSVIYRDGCLDKVYTSIKKFINENVLWDEFIFKDINEKLYHQIFFPPKHYHVDGLLRTVGSDIGCKINTQDQNFKNYIANLGKNTRLRIFNRRIKLSELGCVKVEYFGYENKLEMFSLLNDFHVSRWGKACFSVDSLGFHGKLIDSLHLLDCFSVLKIGGKPVSILYNITINNIVYNLQSGFVENFHKGISLGTLHLGYEIERSFENKDLVYFDLLAGHGKNINYKARLNGVPVKFISIQIVKTKWLVLLYKIKDLFFK